MNIRLSPYVFIFLLLSAINSPGQLQQPKFHLVSGSNGISLGKITSIARDINGVMWFTDQDNKCLTRYDGNRMTRYQNDPKNPNSLGGTYPECVFADSSGIIWIGFYGMGLDRFDPETGNFTHYRHNQKDQASLSNDSVTAILADHLGNLWVGNYGGLDLLDQQTGKFRHYRNKGPDSTSLSCDKVIAIYEDHEGTLWIGTGFRFEFKNEGGLNRFNRKTGTFTRYLNDPKNPHSLINNKVRAIFEDSRGTFWVGTAGDGLHVMDRKTGLFERHTYDPAKPGGLSRPPLNSDFDHITFITEDATGNLWIGTFANGINSYDPLTKTITHFGNNADGSGDFKDNSGWWANASRDGVFWISTQQSNLYRIDLYTNTIPHYETDSFGVNSFYEETPSILWYGTAHGLIYKDLKNGTIHQYLHQPHNPNSLSNDIVVNIVKDEQGDFLLATYGGGINRFNPNTESFTFFKHDPSDNASLNNDTVPVIYQDRESNLWICTLGHGFDLMNGKTGKFTHYQNNPNDTNSISQDWAVSFLEDETNDLWVATVNFGGINRMNRQTGKFKHYLPGISVGNLFRDRDGMIWAGAENGLYRYDRKSDNFSSIDAENAGKIIHVRSIVADNENNLWVGSSFGIFRINKKRDQITLYAKENGIEGESLYFASAYEGPDGELFFGNNNGYYAFYPAKIKISPLVPKIYFSNFWLNSRVVKPDAHGLLNEPISKAKKIFLGYDQNVFSIGVTAVDYGSPEDKKIYYKLENFDREWRQPGTEEKVYYFNVPPGKYIFRVKASNSNNGVWSEKSLTIIISPPWWKTWWAYTLFAILFVAATWVFIHYRSRKLINEKKVLEHKVNVRTAEVMQQKEEIAAQRDNLEQTLNNLKTTQIQLIQSEKMASLGELTAGIAHEIQNPLNFVNNFSEVNAELIDELQEQLKAGKVDEAITTSNDIKENEQKIVFHGKRADAIVKGMLQHSRSSSGVKEPTDINALADEYLRLTYHGLRAKNKSFNATIKTDFDESLWADETGIGKINIVPQDIGRAMLNLLTNAFYAVTEKSASAIPIAIGTGGQPYEPTVTVSTKRSRSTGQSGAGEVQITIKDNGNGIPQKILDKIFQPFFTTKPTGQGTGLGLSLAYDIVKAHSGELKVKTKEGEGTEFVIIIPVQK